MAEGWADVAASVAMNGVGGDGDNFGRRLHDLNRRSNRLPSLQ
jgi:hypothetical protein